MKFLMVFLFITASTATKADDVVDLGAMDVEGEVRGPMMESIESMSEARRLAEMLARKEFLKFEREMLQPQEVSK